MASCNGPTTSKLLVGMMAAQNTVTSNNIVKHCYAVQVAADSYRRNALDAFLDWPGSIHLYQYKWKHPTESYSLLIFYEDTDIFTWILERRPEFVAVHMKWCHNDVGETATYFIIMRSPGI